MAENKNNFDEPIVDVSEAVSKTDELFEKNKKSITYVFGAIAAVVFAIFLYNTYVLAPKEVKADKLIWKAEVNMEKDSIQVALKGKGLSEKGLNQIIDEFGSTQTGNLAHYYAGVAELKSGNYDVALDHLNSFTTSEEVLSILVSGLKGDIYSEKNDLGKAKSYYKDAYASNNVLTKPYYAVKLGLVLEAEENFTGALEVYEETNEMYSTTEYSKYILKSIGRVKQALGK